MKISDFVRSNVESIAGRALSDQEIVEFLEDLDDWSAVFPRDQDSWD